MERKGWEGVQLLPWLVANVMLLVLFLGIALSLPHMRLMAVGAGLLFAGSFAAVTLVIPGRFRRGWSRRQVEYSRVVGAAGVFILAYAVGLIGLIWFVELQTRNWGEWVKDSLASGVLSHWLAALVFGTLLIRESQCPLGALAGERPPLYLFVRVVQPLLFVLVFALVGFALFSPIGGWWEVSVTSWVLLFILDDWAFIDYYVLKQGAPLNRWHGWRMVVCNAAMLGLLCGLAWRRVGFLGFPVAVLISVVLPLLFVLSAWLWYLVATKETTKPGEEAPGCLRRLFRRDEVGPNAPGEMPVPVLDSPAPKP